MLHKLPTSQITWLNIVAQNRRKKKSKTNGRYNRMLNVVTISLNSMYATNQHHVTTNLVR